MDIAKIQVCDNTGVAKGTIALGRVLDIRPSGTSRKVMGRARYFHTFNDQGLRYIGIRRG